MKMVKTMKKYWWPVLLILLSIIALISNLLLACKYWASSYSNVFTAISGWISGVATIVLGIIAHMQSRKYTVISLKMEIKSDIRAEKNKLLEIFNNVCSYSKLTECLPSLVLPPNTDGIVTKLSYKLKVEELIQRVMEATSQLQMFRYSAKTTAPIVSKTIEMITYIYKNYVGLPDMLDNDFELSDKIKEITEKCISWIEEISKLRNDSFKELDNLINTVNECKSASDIEALIAVIENEVQKMRLSVARMIKEKEYEVTDNG